MFTPTYASFLNRIECHFWAIGEFVVKNADYPDWDALAKAMADHITLPQRPPPRPTTHQSRTPTPHRRLTMSYKHNVSGHPTSCHHWTSCQAPAFQPMRR